MAAVKKLDIDDRYLIQNGISTGLSFRAIADKTERSRSTITREVLHNRTRIPAVYHFDNDCLYAAECYKLHLCGDMNCPFECKTCRKRAVIGMCHKWCDRYVITKCNFLANPPYVCNLCNFKDTCTKERFLYVAKEAQENSQKVRKESRSGPQMNDAELKELSRNITRLVKQGQSLYHICADNPDDIKVSESTLYRYIKGCYLEARALDLIRNGNYRGRRKTAKTKSAEDEQSTDKSYTKGRTYNDYKDYTTTHSEYFVTQMDTVIGKQEDNKRILTMLIKRYDFLLIFLLPNGKAQSVKAAFDRIEEAITLDGFRTLFPTILTDRGSEFQQVRKLEFDNAKEYRTNIFYCDPMCSWQKGPFEKVHELIRYVLPKGTSFENLTQEEFTLLNNHINSYRREGLKGKTPFEMIPAEDKYMLKLMEMFNLHSIPGNEVILTPKLLRKKSK